MKFLLLSATNPTNPINATNANTEETFHLLSELHNSPDLTQRELSSKLKISLGKTNYLLNALIHRGLLSIKNFSKNESKVKIKRARYNLTQKGFQEKVRLTYHFLKRKEIEYNQIKKEWEGMLVLEKKKNTEKMHVSEG